MPITEGNEAINDNESSMYDAEGHNLWPGPWP